MTDEHQARAVEEVLSGHRQIVSIRRDHIPGWAEADPLDVVKAKLSCGHTKVWYSDGTYWSAGQDAKIGDLVNCRGCRRR